MQELKNKIKILRTNREWTQAELAEKLTVSESTVQKWETGENQLTIDRIYDIAKVFQLSPGKIIDKFYEIAPFEILYVGKSPYYVEDTEHIVIDANLRNFAKLHRFTNQGGEKYSAIYRGSYEMFSCPREDEYDMINCWNSEN